MFSRGVLEFSENDWINVFPAGKKGRFPNDVRLLNGGYK